MAEVAELQISNLEINCNTCGQVFCNVFENREMALCVLNIEIIEYKPLPFRLFRQPATKWHDLCLEVFEWHFE